jgi:hypothetical protein
MAVQPQRPAIPIPTIETTGFLVFTGTVPGTG